MKASADTPAPVQRKVSRWHLPIWWLNIAAAGALVLAYVAIRVSPAKFWPLAFFGMVYPYVLATQVFFLGWWALFRRKRMLLSAATVLLGWNHVTDFVQMFGSSAKDDDQHVSVMSWNVRLFDLYNWSHNSTTRNEMYDLLITEAPDVFCAQEFFKSDNKQYFNTRDTLLKNFHWTGIHDHYVQHNKAGHHFGIATFSNQPIVGKGKVDFGSDANNACIWTDIAMLSDTVRVYNAHLASIHFGSADYRFMRDLDDGVEGDSLRRGGERIIGRLKNAFIRRAAQVERIHAHMMECPHPIIFCSDMNDTPMSYAYHLLDQDLVDAFEESGRGLGHTYIGDFPSFRIDHIMHSPSLEASGFRTLPDELSDHRPITCWIGKAE
ncbi:MAG: endonuclease/exonuclease/phosphatase family protein [Flavobacteriales bacterium]|nr:MAG: endonuclease/exonuclease/phosphatase family protein [Flavobacteriales bacterium]